ncbi:unnamed protein product [Paramecium primaurelia]|uniref:Casein kinase I n=1 Tax=Paramecium primaurelia TaxID=5886 RepID=A0A8S1JQG2_PARPR|nr:unnamed protein product [Paramecium primaurelia]
MLSLSIFNDRYTAQKKLSSGSFGVVLLGRDKEENIDVAIKIEKEENQEVKSLEREVQVLQRLSNTEGIPNLYWYGQQDDYNIIIIQLLGKDLAYYMKKKRRFSVKTTIQLGIQIVKVLERIHEKGVVHRDLKPENILFGQDNESSKIYIIDFGISKIFQDKNGRKIPFRNGNSFIGTTRYASIAAHKGYELSMKDDLESLMYVLLYFIKGQLPWQNMQNVTDEERTTKVGDMKMTIDPRELCKDVPIEFPIILEYIKALQYRSQPDYNYIYKLFQKSADGLGIILDYTYDWDIPSQKKICSNDMIKSQEMHRSNTLNQALLPPNQQEMKKSLEKGNKNLMRQSSNNNFLTPPQNNKLQPPLLRRSDSQQPSVASNQGSAMLSTYNSRRPKYEQSLVVLDQFEEVKKSIDNIQLEIGNQDKQQIEDNKFNKIFNQSLQNPQISNIQQSNYYSETVGWKDSIFEENYLDDPLSKKYGLLKNNGVDIGKKVQFKNNNKFKLSKKKN